MCKSYLLAPEVDKKYLQVAVNKKCKSLYIEIESDMWKQPAI